MATLYKYPKTLHLPNSPGITNDDKVHKDISFFDGKKVIVTEKMDGENTTMLRKRIHARSLDSSYHPSRDVVKGMWGSFRYEIPKGWRICGENLFAQHSIIYNDLLSYFYGFSIWDENNVCLEWNETLDYFEMLGIQSATGLYVGIFDLDEIMASYNDWKSLREDDGHEVEGFVVRVYDSFHYDDFSQSVAKYVRANHVQTDELWMLKPVVPNGLRQNAN